MLLTTFSKHILPNLYNTCRCIHLTQRENIFGLREWIQQEKPTKCSVLPLTSETHTTAIDMIKTHYLKNHVFVCSRKMEVYNDRALDEYLLRLLKQGSSLYTLSEEGEMSAICVNYATSSVDTKNLYNFAAYRQDLNTKGLLRFISKLQETPNLWDNYKQLKIFEIKMLAVAPKYRRNGIATMLASKSIEQAWDMGYNVVRMDCINENDYKIAERCMMKFVLKFPLHKLGDATAPYIEEGSQYDRLVRVYVADRRQKEEKSRPLTPAPVLR